MKRWICFLALAGLLPVSAEAYSLVTDPKPEELTKLPLFVQTYAYTNSTYSNRMVRFRIYVRETGALTKLHSKHLLLVHPKHGKLFEGPVVCDDVGSRQGIPSIDFTVTKHACRPVLSRSLFRTTKADSNSIESI